MTGPRFVALGLGPPRSSWLSEVTRWANSSALPLEFVKCLSTEETRVRLGTGRPWSALIVDAGTPGIDRDLLELTRQAGAAVLVVAAAGAAQARWIDIGADAVLHDPVERTELLAALDAHAKPITDHTRQPAERPAAPSWRGDLVAVTGVGGAGTSTLAMALGQGLASDPGHLSSVLLADLALDADLALLHDTQDVLPGVQELVDAHRAGRPTTTDVVGTTFHSPSRGYHLLLGLRRHRDWTALRPRAFEAALGSLRATFRVVVADVDADVEGQAECGALEVEERNLMARSTLSDADLVVVVGLPGPRGLHRLVRILAGLLEFGIAATRLLPVVNRAPRSPRARAEMSRAISVLLTSWKPTVEDLAGTLFIGERRRLDDVIHAGDPLPDGLAAPLASAVRAAHERVVDAGLAETSPQQIRPGSLGSFTQAGVGP